MSYSSATDQEFLEALEDAVGPASPTAAQALAEAETAIREADELAATAMVSPLAVKDHLQNLAAVFFTERIKNSSSIEAVRAKAAQMLLGKIDEETSPTQLMRILESLGEMNGVDFQAILGAMSGGAKPGQPGGVTNIFMQPGSGNPVSNSLPPGVTTDTMKMLDSLVQVSETVIAQHGNDANLSQVARQLAKDDGIPDVDYIEQDDDGE